MTRKTILQKGVNDFRTLYPSIAEQISPKEIIKTDEVTVRFPEKLLWLGDCGHEWRTTIKVRIMGANCPYCSHSKLLTGFNDLATIYPDLAAEWSDKNTVSPSQVLGAPARKFWWKDVLGHEWEAKANGRTPGKGCPYCSGRKILEGFNDFASNYPEIAKTWSPKNSKLPSEVTFGSNFNAIWVCNKNHEWKEPVKKRIKGSVCPQCFPGFSKLENIVYFFLEEELKLSVRRRARVIRDNKNKKLEIDLLLEELKLGFEVQDFSTHSRTSDVESSPYKNLKLVKKGPEYHDRKRSLALELLGVKVIDLWEDEILDGSFKNKVLLNLSKN